MANNSEDVRKRIAFERETFDALQLLARDRAATLQELADEAFRDLLKKHNRPVTVSQMLAATVEHIGAHPSLPRTAKRRPKKE